MIAMDRRPPVIIIGMHRSGTSMVTRLLERLGLFVGWKKDPNHEALLFLELNEWLLRQAGATWDRPAAFLEFAQTGATRNLAVEALRCVLGSWPALGFLGPKRFLSGRSIVAMREPWGWKDPRNTVTLPVWLDLFPDARVIHVTRHGVDVAQSLTVRELATPAIGHIRRKAILGLVGYPEILPSPRCRTLEGSFGLWEEYMAAAMANITSLGERHFCLCYEEFLANPLPFAHELASFCGIPRTDTALDDAVSALKPSRAFAFRDDPALKNFADGVEPRISKYGY